jgi:hypothetical protein
MPRRNRSLSILLALALACAFGLSALPVAAQNVTPPAGPAQPQHSDPTWYAQYWNNTTLSGNSVLQRSEANVDYDWGYGSPDPSVPVDYFSARWTRYIQVAPGNYRFTATSDDGIRVSVDNKLIIDQWSIHAATTYTADLYLGDGHHFVVVEYFENNANAVARLSFAPVGSGPIGNWRGEYYNSTDLSGSPALVRDDAQINFDWGTGSPAWGTIGVDYFSVRWTRNLDLPAGNYRFAATVDDGVRLWVNGHLLIDQWRIQSVRTFVGDLYLPGGNTYVQMEYMENTNQAVAKLSWSSGNHPTPVPPYPVPGDDEVTVTNSSGGFEKGGQASYWRYANGGFGGSYVFTRNNDYSRYNYNWGRWYPCLAPGRYEVFVFIPEGYASTARARYWVSYSSGFAARTVNQGANNGRWVSLGTYWFSGTRGDYVSLSDVTGEAYVSRYVAFDSVKWVRR